ncbi:MAG: PPOX class F420-dependent oxidoreductase [Nocardioides sp.]|nr:PPOX class F420-dependent oxidoreductase [Nocardioides sp.]
MSAGRDKIKLTPEELEDYLRSEMKVQVATIGPDGAPHLSTLFYVVDDGKICFWTYGRSQKIRNLERDPRISCLVESGTDYFELRGASITGTAELVRDTTEIARLGHLVATRMVGGADIGELGAAEVGRQAQKRVAVVVTPDKTASWDHSKMVG